MALITEEIILETDTELTIRFTRRNGKYLDKTVPKIENKSNDDLLKIWHRRMTISVLQNRIMPHKWSTPDSV